MPHYNFGTSLLYLLSVTRLKLNQWVQNTTQSHSISEV